MYQRIGFLAARYRVAVVVVWVLLAVLMTLLPPRLASLTTSDISSFLPVDAPFRAAGVLYQATFPNDFSATTVLVVVKAPAILNPDQTDFAARVDTASGRFMAEFKAWLLNDDGPGNIKQVNSPLDSPLIADLLIDKANQVALVNVGYVSTAPARETTLAIESWLKEHQPEGVSVSLTGGFAITQATTESIGQTADSTFGVTIVLVIVLLLVIYRSPISPLLPLLAVTLVYLVSSGVVALIASAGMTVSAYAVVLLVVVLYGAGTDYCLFLISRFREEMALDPDAKRATVRTVERVGETIASSAGTIFVGFMAMAFAEMGLFKTTGPVLAIGVAIMLVAGLTLVPALLALLGKYAFWPGQAVHRPTGGYYERISRWVSNRPLRVLVVITVALLPLAIYGLGSPVSFDLLADLPADSPAVVGYNLVRDSFGAGTTAPLNIVVTGVKPDALAGQIVALADDLRAIPGVADVRSLNAPLGTGSAFTNLLRVDGQLRLILNQVQNGQEGGAAGLGGTNLLAAFTALNDYVVLLGERFPEMADDPNLLVAQDLLGNPLALIGGLDDLFAALEGVSQRFEAMPDAYLMPSALAPLLAAAPALGGTDSINQLTSTYVAQDDTAFKLTLFLSENPASFPAMDTVTAIRQHLAAFATDGKQAVVTGQTAVLTDVRDTISRDFGRTLGFVLLGIFLVLLLMLRSLVAPLYLILTVALTFAFTLGLTDVVFRLTLGVERLSWYMPFFTFIFLVALGVDYSIFLVGRIKEEVPIRGNRDGVHHAVAATGAIITSAGIILAGTFAALMTGSIIGLIELGFAVAVGVLLDTFVVRTMLVPAITVLLGRWAWFPGRLTAPVENKPTA